MSKMPKEIYKAAMAAKPKFPQVFGFIAKYLPRLVQTGNDDLLVDVLHQAATGVRKDKTPIIAPWAYCEVALEQKIMDRNALDSEAAAAQTNLALSPATGIFQEFKAFAKAKAEGRA